MANQYSEQQLCCRIQAFYDMLTEAINAEEWASDGEATCDTKECCEIGNMHGILLQVTEDYRDDFRKLFEDILVIERLGM